MSFGSPYRQTTIPDRLLCLRSIANLIIENPTTRGASSAVKSPVWRSEGEVALRHADLGPAVMQSAGAIFQMMGIIKYLVSQKYISLPQILS
jgi:hypothetical protein